MPIIKYNNAENYDKHFDLERYCELKEGWVYSVENPVDRSNSTMESVNKLEITQNAVFLVLNTKTLSLFDTNELKYLIDTVKLEDIQYV
jgi:hypothetical protein